MAGRMQWDFCHGLPDPAARHARLGRARAVSRRMITDAERFWNARPRRRLDWRDGDDGRAVVLRPAFGESRPGRWLAGRLGNPHYRIRLDEVGAFIWKACDGRTSLTTIATRLQAAFGPRVEPARDRLARFVQTMLRSRMIEM